MTLQDPNARLSPATTRRFRLRGLFLRFRFRRPGAAAGTGRDEQAGPSARARARDLRRLAAIDRRLVAETPHLASMFTLFNRLTTGEGAAGIEQLPPLPRTRVRAVHVAVMVTLAAVVALCFALSTQVHAVTRPCTAPVAAASAATSPARTMSCAAYATNK